MTDQKSRTISTEARPIAIFFMLFLLVFIAFTFFKRCSSTNGPFLTERATVSPAYFLRRMTMKRFVRLLCRVL